MAQEDNKKLEQNDSSSDHRQRDRTITEGTTQTITSRQTVEDATLPPVPPDGGYGWVIMIASFFCNIIVDGVCFR